jgi:hypothetical protein
LETPSVRGSRCAPPSSPPEKLPDGAVAPRLRDSCDKPCHAALEPISRRLACVVHPEAAYDRLQRIYHYDWPRGPACCGKNSP